MGGSNPASNHLVGARRTREIAIEMTPSCTPGSGLVRLLLKE
jgi:hypothetical protein